jgi:hypothetical protein
MVTEPDISILALDYSVANMVKKMEKVPGRNAVNGI